MKPTFPPCLAAANRDLHTETAGIGSGGALQSVKELIETKTPTTSLKSQGSSGGTAPVLSLFV